MGLCNSAKKFVDEYRSFLAFLALAFPLLALQAQRPTAPEQVSAVRTVDYEATAVSLPNPERGFYRHTETHSHQYTPLDLSTLQGYRENENITLILRLFYLQEFRHSDISAAYLAHMQADFAAIRAAGLKAIVRFAYTNQLPSDEQPPFGDASKAQILRHLEQLQPVLQANQDVIAVMQAGFIGVWGEWYYTDHFVDDPRYPWIVSPEQYTQRREVLQALLALLPNSHAVQIRYPFSKQAMFHVSEPLAPDEAFSGSALARVGHHNDCFLASETDFGTYRAGYIAQDKAYVAAESRYLPQGGETCWPNPPRSLCETAVAELAALHWSYLNKDYHPQVLTGWANGGCLPDIERQLGYRLALAQGTYANEVRPGGEFTIEIDLRNEGWAAPFNPRPVEIILRSATALYKTQLPTDPRFWLPEDGPIALNYRICTAGNLPPDAYELLLHLPDPQLPHSPLYAIRLANKAVWEADTGYNKLLHTLPVSGPPVATPPSGSAMLEVCRETLHLPLIIRS